MSGQAPPRENKSAGPVVVRADFDGTESVSANVLLALDELPDFDPASSEEALFEHVDPDALDSLFCKPVEGDRTEGWVSFPIADYEVGVSARGEIVVRGRSD